MDQIAKRISDYIVKDTDLDYEVVKYGVDAILSTALCFSVALLVCTLLGNFIFGILFILFLTPIKMQFDGYHCKTMLQCITTYSLCAGTISLIYHYFITNMIIVPVSIFLIVMCLFTYIVRKELQKKQSIYICFYTLLGCAFFIWNSHIYSIFILSIVFELILVILKHIQIHKN